MNLLLEIKVLISQNIYCSKKFAKDGKFGYWIHYSKLKSSSVQSDAYYYYDKIYIKIKKLLLATSIPEIFEETGFQDLYTAVEKLIIDTAPTIRIALDVVFDLYKEYNDDQAKNYNLADFVLRLTWAVKPLFIFDKLQSLLCNPYTLEYEFIHPEINCLIRISIEDNLEKIKELKNNSNNNKDHHLLLSNDCYYLLRNWNSLLFLNIRSITKLVIIFIFEKLL